METNGALFAIGAWRPGKLSSMYHLHTNNYSGKFALFTKNNQIKKSCIPQGREKKKREQKTQVAGWFHFNFFFFFWELKTQVDQTRLGSGKPAKSSFFIYMFFFLFLDHNFYEFAPQFYDQFFLQVLLITVNHCPNFTFWLLQRKNP